MTDLAERPMTDAEIADAVHDAVSHKGAFMSLFDAVKFGVAGDEDEQDAAARLDEADASYVEHERAALLRILRVVGVLAAKAGIEA
jgi:hypothetical protein